MSGTAATIRRSAQMAAALAPLVPEIATMGSDQNRRERVGLHLRRTADDVGGLFPWIADLIAELPALSGPAVARGVRRELDSFQRGAFFSSDPIEGGEGARRIVLQVDPGLLAVDLGLLGRTVRLLGPLTGRLSPALLNGGIEVIRDQVMHESLLEEELAWRERVHGLSSLIEFTKVDRVGDSVVEILPPSFADPPSRTVDVLRVLVEAWLDGIQTLRLALPDVSWANCRVGITDGRTAVRRLAGAALTSSQQRAALGTMATARCIGSAVEAVSSLLAEELGATADAVAPVASAIVGFTHRPEGQIQPGSRVLLRELDRAVRSSRRSPRLTRGLFLIVRQLALFRAMADEVGVDGSIFATADNGQSG